jgi:hypothetical protein
VSASEKLPWVRVKFWRWGAYLYIRTGKIAHGWAIKRTKL